MKISKQEKAATRNKILAAASEVIAERGFKAASMREIARRAEVGDATIYNYFPSKEKLLFGYCENRQHEVAQALRELDGFDQYTIQEQLHQLIETELTLWLPDREFLGEVFDTTFYSPSASLVNLAETRRLFNRMVDEIIDNAVEAGEIPEQPYQSLLAPLYWDYTTAVLAYWLRDDSEGFANTTRLVDQSVELIAIVLQTGVISKTMELVSFLFRSHISRTLNSFSEYTRPWKKAKRQFMASHDD
ncbi:MAG: TetR/AcrR family transcriptional regulator [Candidatus Thiodiazotropha sp. 'RUGA']|nr:TetR/AcrR family transcriptional regulator [Candidatus Thiodiazotropha sp. 'RUGA']